MDTPNFAGTVLAARALLNAANTARDGTGTLVSVLTAPAAGARIDKLRVKALGTTSVGTIRVFAWNPTGSVATLLAELPVPATAPAATDATWSRVLDSTTDIELPILLPASWELRCTSHTADLFHISAIAGGF
jgi:hypothetical protein